ncbi:unnamed protein product [Rotaria sp. Silwood2]|nr:unnamed protein product [Rotaria sp. Silwood2]CAF3195243.1 unnamed protein product [Rotaria sp. Silwood2]CAF3283078.1 unnamed protein product [Rotaria sp. Silwood2]CAF3338471.1 unnamed protein product [Rotaria sp. Silwood2]CAF4255399.1 unnamed protein product [Rotaria sp. Silwood2]
MPTMPLEEAVKSITKFYPKFLGDAEEAKEKSKKTIVLSIDASAAIYLYTMNRGFYKELNKMLRNEDPDALQPWLAYLKLFITVLEKLPSCSKTVWRGVRDRTGTSNLAVSQRFIWWSVNSCTSDIKAAECFKGDSGALLCINAIYAKDITTYSAMKDEEEIIPIPGTCLRIESLSLENTGGWV